MNITMNDAQAQLTAALARAGLADAGTIAEAAVWLEACGYPGLQLLAEALADDLRSLQLERGLIGLDLQNVSCAFLAPAIIADVKAHGRIFLRNVRHGLFLVPFSVRENLGIGCPVDPAFALGGERTKNPYGEKLALAAERGLTLDDDLWRRVTAA